LFWGCSCCVDAIGRSRRYVWGEIPLWCCERLDTCRIAWLNAAVVADDGRRPALGSLRRSARRRICSCRTRRAAVLTSDARWAQFRRAGRSSLDLRGITGRRPWYPRSLFHPFAVDGTLRRCELLRSLPRYTRGSMMPYAFAARSTLVVSMSAAALFGCDWGARCAHSCPVSTVAVNVPADRVSDVDSVTSAGPCQSADSVDGFRPGLYFFSPTGDGVCQITVLFRSGAPNFVGSVGIAPNPGPCCVGQATFQNADINVPEVGSVDSSSGN
jgi:hypothetical protein